MTAELDETTAPADRESGPRPGTALALPERAQDRAGDTALSPSHAPERGSSAAQERAETRRAQEVKIHSVLFGKIYQTHKQARLLY